MAAEFRISKRKAKKVAAVGGAVGAAVLGRRLVRSLPGTRNVLAKLKKLSRKSAAGRLPGKIRGVVTRSRFGAALRGARVGRRLGKSNVAGASRVAQQSRRAAAIRVLRGGKGSTARSRQGKALLSKLAARI